MSPVVRLPGLVDVHVHLREPGGEHKETFATGTAAALAGGVTLVLAMPNTSPPIVDERAFMEATRRAQAGARCDYALFLGATHTNAPLSPSLQRRAAGLKIYVNETFGPLRVTSLPALIAHMRQWRGPGPVAVHAEGLMVPAIVALAAMTGARVHFCHISRAAELAVIRAAKEQGLPVTCEVTPHHLWLTEQDVPRLGSFGQMRPPLATPADRDALWANLDVIDCVATDHAPHTREEKAGPAPPPGVPGLETMLPLLLTAVHEGRLTMERLVALTHTCPMAIFNLPPQPDTWVDVDLGAEWVVPEQGWHTRVDWSPFAGLHLRGRVVRTQLRGDVVYESGRVIASPGSGRDVRTTTHFTGSRQKGVTDV
ncbi:MAG: amidohydrolase family protein [Ardenticatenia bacterium]|nr:amidohydrolase family protein [Ardenticatenia bacterium]